jgi:hypothetical protein
MKDRKTMLMIAIGFLSSGILLFLYALYAVLNR